MGTNYYLRINECDICHRYDEVHLCKINQGWKPLIQASTEIKSFDDFRNLISLGSIYDEYGSKQSKISLVSKLEIGKEHDALRSHSKYNDIFIDSGHEFCMTEFS